jgi:hypothetical protein
VLETPVALTLLWSVAFFFFFRTRGRGLRTTPDTRQCDTGLDAVPIEATGEMVPSFG